MDLENFFCICLVEPCSSLSELCLPGESVSCQIQGESVGWWGNIIFPLARRGVFQGGSPRHVDVSSSRGSTRHVVTAYRYRGSTSHVVAACQGTMPSLRLSVGKILPSPIQPVVPIPLESFFSVSIHRIRHAHTLTHLRPGPSGVTGLIRSLLDMMGQNLGC